MTTHVVNNFSPAKAVRLIILAMLSVVIIAAFSADANSANLRKYAGIVVDAKTGKTLYASGADATRYPASVTKVMTLYLVFQELEAGRMSLKTKMRVSKYAAGAQPSKLYLKIGSSITVSDAIFALVTKSANDVARVIAEHISGTEGNFARRMTKTARAMGMSRTTYRNANGLPHTKQITTVRDQAVLARAIFQHYPQYYKYFKTRSFRYRGKSYGNHNRLLGKVRGVDGLKTGYTRASGFNLLTSARYNGRHIVVAAFGFSKSASRNAKVTQLIGKYLTKARKGSYRRQAMIKKPGRYNGKKGSAVSPTYAVASVTPRLRPAHMRTPGQVQTLVATAPQLASQQAMPLMTQAPATPIIVASLSPTSKNGPRPILRPFSLGEPERAPTRITVAKIVVAKLVNPTQLTAATPIAQNPNALVAVNSSALEPINLLLHRPTNAPAVTNTFRPPLPPNTLGFLPPADIGTSFGTKTLDLITGSIAPAPAVAQSAATPTKSAAQIGGWIVQLGAAPDDDGANRLIASAKKRGKSALNGLSSYVQEFEKGGAKFYRARIAGFTSKIEARATCRKLKAKKIGCLAMPA